MKINKVFIILTINIVLAFLFTHGALAEACRNWIAKAVSVQGDVEVRKAGETQWQEVHFNDVFCAGDTVRVQEKSRAGFYLANETTLRLDQSTAVTFLHSEDKKTTLINVLKGIAHFFSGVPRSLKITTPFVNGSVDGTEFVIKVDDDKTVISVYEGRVDAENESGRLSLTGGQSVIAEKDKSPALHAVVRPRDAVRWALYYPAIFYHPDRAMPSDWQLKVSSLLSVGRFDEAEEEIKTALKVTPVNGDALAVQSLIAVVQNEKEIALKLADAALDAGPASSPAHLAFSYALQAGFDLSGALSKVEKAVKLEPENALAWARLSELFLSFGSLDEALHAAGKAVAINPDIARAQTVLGFAHLSQINISAAEEAFEKAIALDQADPLARLGLGLAKIRTGNLTDGRVEIEIAASLDPNNSLIRSYLGKAYFEEKRDSKASAQFQLAKEIDPLDPTPFFYDAIRKQSLNQPVDALRDLQTAIVLNDNRAVYRSRLLLDSDLAARSASLGRIYSDLGFQQLALSGGWKSFAYDPSDYSAHRLLADSYSVLPRHEIARVSELLQSQLLQPVNITPVQPHLAESNLSILNGAGPADASFNEFNPLFNRNRYTFQMSGIAGSNRTSGDELVLSGVQGRASFSIGQFHYETEGFRKNNDQTQDIYNMFAQANLSHNTSVQAELRYKETKSGDLTLNFFPDDYLPSLRQDDESKSIRLGIHHTFSRASDIVGSFMTQSAKFNFRDSSVPGVVFDKKTDTDSYSAELQHLLRFEHISFISGAGHFWIDSDHAVKFISPAVTFSENIAEDIKHNNLYFYTQINYVKNMTLTAGGSADFFKNNDDTQDQFNPKLGITWRPFPATTFRAAAFRILKRTLVTNQTLEPTQIAGFNQFFDDEDGADSWRYGMAADQKFSDNISGGVEYSARKLKVPFMDVSESRKLDWEEKLSRAYIFWTPHRWLSLSAEYNLEKLDIDKDLPHGINNVKTHRFPLGINLFHSHGFSAMLKATYIDQEGTFKPQLSGLPESGEDQFWVADASIRYRLPKRFGVIALEAKNIFNQSFKYQDIDPVNPQMQPKRSVYLKFTLAL